MRATTFAVVAGVVGAVVADDTYGGISLSTTGAVEPTSSYPVDQGSYATSAVDPVGDEPYPTDSESAYPTTEVYVTDEPTSSDAAYPTTDSAAYPTESAYPTTEVYVTDEPTSTYAVSTTDSPVTTSTGGWEHWTASSNGTTAYTTTTEAVYTTSKEAETTAYPTTVVYDTTEYPSTVVYHTSGGVKITSTTTITSTITKTVTTYPTDTGSSSWAEWATTPGWSSDGWWGPVWPTAGPGECVQNVITGYGEGTWKPEAPKPTTPAYTTPATSDVYSTPVYSTPAAPTPSGSYGGGNGGGIGGKGNSWGMTYSPYTADSGCKAKEVIAKDVANMAAKGFSSIRVYSTDCNTLEYVGEACKANNMKMIIGVFISSTGIGGADKQVKDIVSWGQWDLVELVVVGNEALFNKYCSVDELAGLIASTKETLKGAGYSGKVTTTEDLATWTSVGSSLCGVVDVVAANLYAYFNPNVTPEKAGDFIQAQIEELSGVCGDKDTYVMESGWPSAGECNGSACPGKENQATAIKSIQQTNGAKVIWFSYEDELWKQPGEHGVEQHWGCSDVFNGGSNWSTY